MSLRPRKIEIVPRTLEDKVSEPQFLLSQGIHQKLLKFQLVKELKISSSESSKHHIPYKRKSEFLSTLS